MCPDSNNSDKDAELVVGIFKDILDEVPPIQQDLKTKKARLHRLGRYIPGRNRTIKCYLNSQEDCEQLLMQSRLLQDSRNYSNIIVQADLTPMQRFHIKQLVLEKRRRNSCARENNEEADWVIRNGKLCRKRNLNSSLVYLIWQQKWTFNCILLNLFMNLVRLWISYDKLKLMYRVCLLAYQPVSFQRDGTTGNMA